MKTVFVLFDSLNRHYLGPYGGTDVPTPNFDRLAQRTAVFEQHHVGSMPCMPARRDMMTGRLSFLHRSWGPIEPFDRTFPDLLRNEKGTYSHFITDHFHYWEDGGATFQGRYDSHEFFRGQEGDGWNPVVAPDWDSLKTAFHPVQFSDVPKNYKRHNMMNRERIRQDADYPASKVFDAGLAFLERNRDADNWIVQIETFDPHEPFQTPDRFKAPFDTGWNGPALDWPPYDRVTETDAEANELRANYKGSLAHCDFLLGRLLDVFDRDDLWKDTALIVTTDHGYLLGEHDFWAKNRMNVYQELAHIPLFVHDPRNPGARRVRGLTQTPDIARTLLDLHGGTPPPEMMGQSVLPMLDGAPSRHDAVLFGYFGGGVNVTDGRHSYHRFPPDLADQDLYQYTLMPTHIFDFFSVEELEKATLAPPLPFSRNVPVLKVPVRPGTPMYRNYGPGVILEDETRLYDLATDPGQVHPLDDPATELRMAAMMADLMRRLDAPPEAFARLSLDRAAPS